MGMVRLSERAHKKLTKAQAKIRRRTKMTHLQVTATAALEVALDTFLAMSETMEEAEGEK